MNRELFQRIDEIIRVGDEIRHDKFYMNSWESGCGTARCVAGWAIHLTTGEPVFGPDHHLSRATVALVEQLGVRKDCAELGGKLLGMERSDSWLFYTDEETAAEFVRLAAAGEEEAARALRDFA